MPKVHVLKTWPDPFHAIRDGIKPWEYRQNDRDFQVGDILVLEEFDPDQYRYTGEKLQREVMYILRGPQFGIPDGFCIMTTVPSTRSITQLQKYIPEVAN